jgi:type IV pilus assembly protein PilO
MADPTFFEKIERIKTAHRILIFVGTIALLTGLFVWLVVWPWTSEIAQKRQEIQGLDQKIYQAKIRAKDLPKFEAELKEVNAQFQEALRLLPNEREIPNLLRSITEVGTEAHLDFRYFSPQKERAKEFYYEIPVAIEVSGSYHNVASFFDAVGRMERIVNILEVSMKPVKERSTQLITKCTAVTYRFKGDSDVKDKKKNDKKKK